MQAASSSGNQSSRQQDQLMYPGDGALCWARGWSWDLQPGALRTNLDLSCFYTLFLIKGTFRQAVDQIHELFLYFSLIVLHFEHWAVEAAAFSGGGGEPQEYEQSPSCPELDRRG